MVRHYRHLLAVGAALIALMLLCMLSVGADATPQASIPARSTTVTAVPAAQTTRVTTPTQHGTRWGFWLLILAAPTVFVVGGLFVALQARREYLATMARKAAAPSDDPPTAQKGQ